MLVYEVDFDTHILNNAITSSVLTKLNISG